MYLHGLKSVVEMGCTQSFVALLLMENYISFPLLVGYKDSTSLTKAKNEATVAAEKAYITIIMIIIIMIIAFPIIVN